MSHARIMSKKGFFFVLATLYVLTLRGGHSDQNPSCIDPKPIFVPAFITELILAPVSVVAPLPPPVIVVPKQTYS